jgi:hypothetical protein
MEKSRAARMKIFESYRKMCLKQQTELRRTMMDFTQHDRAIQLFFRQHAMLHSAKMAQVETWSFEDEVLKDMSEEQIRLIPRSCEHSIAWLIWHIARCEDITMNLLVADSPQVLHRDNWVERMKITTQDTGNAMDEEDVAEFSQAIDVDKLRAYRIAVGRRTREIVKELQPGDLKKQVESYRVKRVMDEGAVVEAARGIAEYWGKRNIAGLLLMPATRHNLIHLNEALQVKHKVERPLRSQL